MKTLRLAAVALAAVTTLGLAGCGSSEEDPPPVSQGEQDKRDAFAECMQKHGVEIGENAGGFKAADPNDMRLQAAQAACRKLAPAPHKQGGGPSAEEENRALKMAECLRKKGVNAKDPEPGSIQLTIEEGPSDTPEKTVAAYTACNKEVPAAKGS